MSDPKSILKTIKEKEIQFVDLRFTDPRGKMQTYLNTLAQLTKNHLLKVLCLTDHLLQDGKLLMSQI